MEEQIKAFLQQIIDQDNRSTAFPYFYVIRSEVESIAPTDNCEYTKWYWQEDSFNSLEELKQYLKDNEYSKEEIKNALDEAYEYGVRKDWTEHGMFLTETDAMNHLKLNYYHYSSNAHTYVKHAWRAPELTHFLNNLMSHFNIRRSDG